MSEEIPFADIASLRAAQDYSDCMGEQAVISFPVRTLREGMHLRVCDDPVYRLENMFVAETKTGLYFVYPQYREALSSLCKCSTLYLAVDGHGTYFLLRCKRPMPGFEANEWFRTARVVAEAAMIGWVKVTKPSSDDSWSYIPVQNKMFEPKWPDKSLEEILRVAFPDRVVNRPDHDLIKQVEERGV
jgi:hypothetical protein